MKVKLTSKHVILGGINVYKRRRLVSFTHSVVVDKIILIIFIYWININFDTFFFVFNYFLVLLNDSLSS